MGVGGLNNFIFNQNPNVWFLDFVILNLDFANFDINLTASTTGSLIFMCETKLLQKSCIYMDIKFSMWSLWPWPYLQFDLAIDLVMFAH